MMIALTDNMHVGALDSTGAVMEGVLIRLDGALDSVIGAVEEGVLIDGVDKRVSGTAMPWVSECNPMGIAVIW